VVAWLLIQVADVLLGNFGAPAWVFKSFVALLLLGGGYLAVRATGQADRLLPLLVMLWSLEPWLVLPYAASDAVTTRMGYEAAESWILMGLLLWVILAWIRVMGLAFAADRFRAAALAAFLFVVAVLPQWLLPYNELWYVYDTDEDAPEVAVNVEDVFYAQHALVAEAVDSLAGDRPGVVDLYHVGFGSYAHQAVFRREVEHVRAILDERFDTAGRSLALINFADTVGRVPIASRSNLELALQGVAARMNTEEDVLLLYLTSHGSPNGKLSVSFWPLQLNDLTAQDLRRMLDDSGIRWRVIVVSACYSGTFIDALQDEGTLVITASARDRNSFGCSNENEYTYFGEAFFRDALAETRSFAAGFERAKAIVTRREKEEGRKPSEPKLVSGEAIAAKLAVLEARLSSAAAAD